MTTADFSVFVNSSDAYEDCWGPFFTLLRRYWPECRAPLMLNTERRRWSFDGLDVRCTAVQPPDAPRLTWSECLLAGLAQVQTPLVLYVQEDYFLHRPVLDERVRRIVDFMLANPHVRHVGLTKHGSHGPFESFSEPGLFRIRQRARYRVSTQAGLWRVDALASYLERHENGWMFEIYGTWRAHRRPELFLTADCAQRFGGPPVDYLHTGIIKGQWLPQMAGVFSANGIEVDFRRRGFYREKGTLARKVETARRLLSDPRYFVSQFVRAKLR